MTSRVEINIRYQEKERGRKMCKCPFLNRISIHLTKEELYKNKIFSAFNWVTLLAVVSLTIFSGITRTSTNNWDMSRYCNGTKFNKPVTPITKLWAILTVAILVVTTILMMSVKMIMYNKITKDIFNIANYLIGFLLSWDITYILQNLLSYPIPSFYTIEKLKLHYCTENGTENIPFSEIEKLDLSARGSFPSFLICALFYSTIIFYLFCYDSKNIKSCAAKFLTLFIPGMITVAYAFLLWKNNENHIQDIFGGSLIGIFMAMYIMKDVLIKDSKFDRMTDNISLTMSQEETELNQLNSEENDRGGEERFSNECTVDV